MHTQRFRGQCMWTAHLPLPIQLGVWCAVRAHQNSMECTGTLRVALLNIRTAIYKVQQTCLRHDVRTLIPSAIHRADKSQNCSQRTTQTIQCVHKHSPQSRPWAAPKVCLVCGYLGGSALVCWLLREAQLAACQALQHPTQAPGAAAAAVDDGLQNGADRV
jgi:hypothetical protein